MKTSDINSIIIFPAFVSMFINNIGKTCIYYFRGLDKDNQYIYQQINEEQMPPHNTTINDDGSVIYEFKTKITHIKCKLVSLKDDIPDEIIYI